MAEKTLKELLSKYIPPEEYLALLEEAKVISTRVEKEKRFLEVRASFTKIVDKKLIY